MAGRSLSDEIEDVAMVCVMVFIPCVYLFLATKMWMNYDALIDKESPTAELYGYFCKNVALDEVGKTVGLIASFLSTIRAMLMTTILVFF